MSLCKQPQKTVDCIAIWFVVGSPSYYVSNSLWMTVSLVVFCGGPPLQCYMVIIKISSLCNILHEAQSCSFIITMLCKASISKPIRQLSWITLQSVCGYLDACIHIKHMYGKTYHHSPFHAVVVVTKTTWLCEYFSQLINGMPFTQGNEYNLWEESRRIKNQEESRMLDNIYHCGWNHLLETISEGLPESATSRWSCNAWQRCID